MNDYKKIIGYVKLIIVISIWGGSYHVAKYMIGYTDIFTISFIRFLIASVLLWFIFLKQRGVVCLTNKSKNHWILLFMLGFIGVFAYNMAFFGSEILIPANNVATIFAFTPCLTIILSMIFLRQKLNLLGYCGVIIALIGVLSVIMIADTSCDQLFCTSAVSDRISLGELLALLSAFAMAGYNILNRVAAQANLDPMTVTTFSATFGAICLGIVFLFYGHSISDLYNKPWQFWLALAYMSVLATVLCYKWYSDAIHEIGVAKTVIFQSGVPVSAVFIGLTFLGERMQVWVVVAGAVVILGVLITNMALNKDLAKTSNIKYDN